MPRRKKKLIEPDNVLKETVYFGSGDEARRIAAMLNADMTHFNSDLSPLIVLSYTTWHAIGAELEAMAREANIPAGELLTKIFKEYQERQKKS